MRKGMAAATGTLLFPALVVLFNCCSPVDKKTSPATHTITISAMQFQPAELYLEKGDTVVFINKDIVTHDVTEINNKAWGSPPLAPGQSFQLVVTKGASYYCTFHPVMKGVLTVN